MNCGITRWKVEPLKCSGLPERPVPFSPVHRQRKFCGKEQGAGRRFQGAAGTGEYVELCV